MTRRGMVFWGLVAALGLVTHLRGLGATALWQDEAETAVLGQRVLRSGVPLVDDGKNYVSQNQGRDHDPAGRWDYSPWLGYFLAAGGIGALGATPFAARLPFALCALGCLPLLYVLSRRWSGSEAVARAAVLLLSVSVPWLLFARQCRAYPLAALTALYLWWAYEEFLAGGKWARLHVVAASVLLFHANFLLFFAVAGGVLLHFLAVEARSRPVTKADFRAALAFFLVMAPGMSFFHVFARAGGAGGVPVSHLGNLRELAQGLDAHVLPAFTLALALWAARGRASLRKPLVLLAGGLVGLVAAPHFFFRYLVVFLPLAAHVLAETGAAVFESGPVLAGAALVFLFTTNAFSLGFWLGRRPLAKTELVDMTAELLRPPADTVLAAATSMGPDYKPGDVALVSYPDLSFMFHTRYTVIGGGQGLRPVKAEAVKWVVVRDEAEKSSFPLDWSRYEPVTLPAPDGPWGNRPDPDLHVFRTPVGRPAAVIYRKRA